jgi:hypothetical protein
MDCLPLEDVCNLQASFEQRIADDVEPVRVDFEFKNTSLYKIDGEWVIVIIEKEFESWQ